MIPVAALAVVGSTSFVRPEAKLLADSIIAHFIGVLGPAQLVSGGAEGVDTWAKEIGAVCGYTIENGRFVEYLPMHRQWEPDGFKARNIFVATTPTTHLLVIRCHASKTYGSGWTADYAEKRGRTVYRVTL